MNITKALNIVSAAAGFIGTLMMSKGTFGFVVAGAYMDVAGDAATRKANDRRAYLQRWGLALLTVSFLLQGIAQFTPE